MSKPATSNATDSEPVLASDERLACLYSDGSLNVANVGRSMEDLRDQVLDDDEHEDDPAHFTRIVRIRLEVLETIETPSAVAMTGEGICQACGRPHAVPAMGRAR